MRKMLIALSALGIGAATLTGTSIYAPGTDSGMLGRFDVSSGTVSNAVDILMAPMEQDACGAFVNSTNLKIDVSMPADADEVLLGDYCVKNNGRVPVDIELVSFVVENTELACSPGEAEAGDSSCGEGEGDLPFVTNLTVTTATTLSRYVTNVRSRKVIDGLNPGDIVPVHLKLEWGSQREMGQSDFMRLDSSFYADAS